MAKFIIQGGQPLKGAVRIGGAKNASFKLMIASLLLSGETRILNLSNIGDVATTGQILKYLGAKVESRGERTVFISPNRSVGSEIPTRFGKISRTSSLFVGPLLYRTGRAAFPLPGGDALGPRPIERSLAGWQAFGAKVKVTKNRVLVSCPHLRGGRYRFAKPTHTGTEAMIMTAVCARGESLLENVACEPEIDDLIAFLDKAGAKIKRLPHRRIKIEGVSRLRGVIHAVMPDRNEAVSYACAALATKGDIIIENARAQDMMAFLKKIKQIGGRFETDHFGIRFWYEKPLKATTVETQPHPGFMTDWQPLWSLLMTQARGKSKVIERVQNFRFHWVPAINQMGAKIRLFNPRVKNPESYYNFTLSTDRPEYFHGAYIEGPTRLKAIKADFPDIRAGATLTVAALMARGESVLGRAEEVDRGYEDLAGRLKELGARIKRIP